MLLISGSPLDLLIKPAYAAVFTARRISGKHIIEMLSDVAKTPGKFLEKPKDLSTIFKEIRSGLYSTEAPNFRKFITKLSFIKAGIFAYRTGLNRLRNFIKGDKNSRTRPILLLSAMVYIQDQLDNIQNDNSQHIKIFGVVADALSGKSTSQDENKRHGAQFQLVMIAYYQLLNQTSGGEKLRDVEASRKINYFQQKKVGDDLNLIGVDYKRRVDIILGPNGENEIWVELKSKKSPLKKNDFTQSRLVGKNKTNQMIHREFTADWIGLKAVGEAKSRIETNKEIQWRFQDFETKPKSTVKGPSESELKIPRDALCEQPNPSKHGYHRAMFGNDSTAKSVKNVCKGLIDGIVELQNTRTMLEDVFLPKGVAADLKDFIE